MEREAVIEFSKGKPIEWFDRRLKVKAQRALLLGLNGPQRIEASGPGGGPIRVSEIIVEIPREAVDEAALAAVQREEEPGLGIVPVLPQIIVELPDE